MGSGCERRMGVWDASFFHCAGVWFGGGAGVEGTGDTAVFDGAVSEFGGWGEVE